MALGTTTIAGSDAGPNAGADQPADLRYFVFALFFIFGGITSLNDVIIPKLKELFTLNYTQAMLIQFCFFTAYLVIGIPGAKLVKRIGYMRGVVAGLVIMMIGCLIFIPASQTGVPKGGDLSALVKTTVQMKITEVNRARRRVVGSIRAVTNELRKAAQEKIWAEIEVGKKYTGVVKSLTSYGAFVDIGGVDGPDDLLEDPQRLLPRPPFVAAAQEVLLRHHVQDRPHVLGHPAVDEHDAFGECLAEVRSAECGVRSGRGGSLLVRFFHSALRTPHSALQELVRRQ